LPYRTGRLGPPASHPTAQQDARRGLHSRRGKCFLRGGLTIPPSPVVRPYDSRHRFGSRGRPWDMRRMGRRRRSRRFGNIFGSWRHGAQGRPDAPSPTRPVMLTWPPPHVVPGPAWDRGAAAARRIPPTSMSGPPVKLPVRSVPTHAWSVLRGPPPVANFYPGPSETEPPETVSAAVVDHQPEHLL
jgi:hypothetical protein